MQCVQENVFNINLVENDVGIMMLECLYHRIECLDVLNFIVMPF